LHKFHNTGFGNGSGVFFIFQNIKIMKKYIIKHWAVSSRTFRKTHIMETIVDAYDEQHARLVIDRHPDLIVSVKRVPDFEINIQIFKN